MLYLDKLHQNCKDLDTKKGAYIIFLEETIRNIADIIYMEMPLRVQDEWLNSVIQDELYTPEED